MEVIILAREVDGITYLETNEVKEKFGWSRDALYRLKRIGRASPRRFFGNKKSYWNAQELEIIANTAFEPEDLRPKRDPSSLLEPTGV
jgi:hypothetical protein